VSGEDEGSVPQARAAAGGLEQEGEFGDNSSTANPMPPPQHRSSPQLAPEQLRQRLGQAMQAGVSAAALLQQALDQLQAAPQRQWLDYAAAFAALGAVPLTVAVLEHAVRRWPQAIELRYELGNALRRAQRPAEAEAMLRGVLSAEPRHERAALSLAFMLRDSGRMDAAAAAMLELWRGGGHGAEAALKAGKFLEECSRPRLAAQVYEEALAAGGRDARLLAGAGDMAQVLGDFERARQRLLAALDAGLNPAEWTGIPLMLANTQKYRSADHPDFPRFEQIWCNPALAEGERIAAGFALGKACADIGDHAGAVKVLRQANELQRRRRPWPSAAWQQFVAAQMAQPLPPAQAAAAEVIPVFVVGLPRTGTTLVAEKLADHPRVRSRGEMNWLPFLAHELAARQQWQQPDALRQAASIYLSHLRQDDAPAHWYIDKNPHNFRHLGLIQALFPQARIIHCVRERRDTALSIWSQYFAHQDLDYAYSLADIAAFAEGHDRLMRHWRAVLSMPLFELEYERMVDQPDHTLRQLGGFLGLDEDSRPEQVVRDSAVSTASVWQARQPVYRAAVGRWRQYAPHLPELLTRFPEPASRG